MTLLLLPNLLGQVQDHHLFLPVSVDLAVQMLDGLIAESVSEGRRFLKRFKTKKPAHQIPIALMDENPDFLLEPLQEGETWGLVADAGLPCLADPGFLIVKRARALKIPVTAFAGPSSIFLSLMLSGLPAQNFSFHGYIPKKPEERTKSLKLWEKQTDYTHLFIEAPYRNIHTFHTSLETLKDTTQLCIASHLTLPDEWVHTALISTWKKKDFTSHFAKKPTIFLFSSSSH